MDDEKYMLRKSVKGHFVKLDAPIFYQLLEHNLTVKHLKVLPTAVCFWKKGVSWSNERPAELASFIMKAEKGQVIDHINRNIFDNRKINLRTANYRQNMLNSFRRNPKMSFHGIHVNCTRGYNYWRTIYCAPEKKRLNLGFKFSVLGLFLAAVTHDKMIIESNEEDYAPLNFQMFKIPAFKKVLLATDIKLLRSIYLGRKNKNTEKTIEKTKPEKKNIVYKNQFFFNFRV